MVRDPPGFVRVPDDQLRAQYGVLSESVVGARLVTKVTGGWPKYFGIAGILEILDFKDPGLSRKEQSRRAVGGMLPRWMTPVRYRCQPDGECLE